jgi:hypothetical protein
MPRPGDVILLFGTGLGATNPAVASGMLVSTPVPVVRPVSVRIGGADARVLFAGLVSPGLYQLNVTVPSELPAGDAPVVVEMDGARSQQNVFLPIAPQDSPGQSELPKATGATIREYLQNQDIDRRWPVWPGTQRFQPGQAPHGALVTILVNSETKDAIDRRPASLPAGSIVVKQNYMPDRTLAATTVMYKVRGFDPEHKDWFWLMLQPDGGVAAEGTLQDCAVCHRGASDNDYIFTGPLK